MTSNTLPATDGYRRTAIADLFSLKGRTVVVTGGARGLGLSFAWAAAEAGANVAVFDLLDTLHDDFYLLEKELGVKARFYRFNGMPHHSVDVTKYEHLKSAFGEVHQEFGSIDHCITAAGINRDKPFLEHTPADMKALLAVNVRDEPFSYGLLQIYKWLFRVEGSFYAAQLAAQHMKDAKRGGSIIMVASIAAHGSVPGKDVSGYCFTKGAILSGCRALADELVGDNIRVNTISPGFILTDMTVANIANRPNVLEDIPKNIPMRRIGDRRDLKGAIILLLSNASAYTTGSDLLIDGGLIAH